MGLHFIYGRAGSGKTTRCIKEITSRLSEDPSGSIIFLVPDQETYHAESLLASASKGKGFINVMVSGFSRLAFRIFQELHTETNRALSPLGQQLVIARLLSEHREEFHVIGKAAGERHFSETLTAFFHELETYLITPEKLLATAEAEGETPLGLKLRDLSLLYREYHDYLKNHFAYEGSTYELLAKVIPKSEIIARSHIWIDGFNGMTPQEIRIVYALIERAKDVTVTLPMDSPEEAALSPVWNRPYRMWQFFAERYKNISGTTLSGSPRFLSPGIREMVSHYFTEPLKKYSSGKEDPAHGIHYVSAFSREQEADITARRILSLVRDHGYRYRDILVLLRNEEAYSDALERKLSHYGIPAFMNKREPMNNHPLVILLSSLFQFLTAESRGHHRGWSRQRIFRLLKTDIIPSVSADEMDILENFILKHGIRFYHWDREWNVHIPRDIDTDTGELTEREKKEQAFINDIRLRVLSLLTPLTSDFLNAETVAQKCKVIYEWLMKEQIPNVLSRWDDREFEKTRQRPHIQVWKKVLSMLDEMVHVAGDDKLAPDAFLSMAEDGLASLSYSMIPPTLDHVTVTTVDRGYSSEGRAVFLLGVIEDEFPARIDDSGFLTEEEKQHIRKEEQLVLGPGIMSLIFQEQFYVYLAMTRAKELLVLTSASIDNDGKTELSPSFLIRNLMRQGYIASEETAPLPAPDTTDDTFLTTPEESLSLLPSILREGLPSSDSVWASLRDWTMSDGSRKKLMDEKLEGLSYSNQSVPLSADLARALYSSKKGFTGSVSQFEMYRQCPYKYFLNHGLHLEDRDQSELDSRDFGNYLHAGLHLFGSRLHESKKQWRDATDDDIKNISSEIADHIIPKIKNGILSSDETAAYTSYSLQKTLRSTLARLRRWSKSSSFNTTMLEKKFFLKLTNEYNELYTVQGKIDRVDASDNLFTVSDYKTGIPKLTLSSILTGEHLQLITYLLAIMENDKSRGLLPAAMVYIYLSGDAFSISAPPEEGEVPSQDTKDLLSGYFIKDREILSSLDNGLGTDNQFIPVRLTKSGIHGNAPALTADEFKELLKETRRILGNIYHELISGDIPIRPARFGKTRSPCTYCEYRSICRFDTRLGGRYDEVSNARDKEVKEKLHEKMKGETNE